MNEGNEVEKAVLPSGIDHSVQAKTGGRNASGIDVLANFLRERSGALLCILAFLVVV